MHDTGDIEYDIAWYKHELEIKNKAVKVLECACEGRCIAEDKLKDAIELIKQVQDNLITIDVFLVSLYDNMSSTRVLITEEIKRINFFLARVDDGDN